MKPTEIVFEVTEASDGGFDASVLGHAIFARAGRPEGNVASRMKVRCRLSVLTSTGRVPNPHDTPGHGA